MNFRLIRSIALAAALAAASALVAAPMAPAAAAQSVSAKVGTPLKAAQDLAKQRKFKEALDKVAEAEAVEGKTPFEVVTIQKFKLYLYSQLRDYANAARATEAALATGQLTAEETKSYKRQLALFYFSANNTTKGVAAAKTYIAQYGNDDELLLQLAQQAYQGKDYASAADAAQKIVRGAEAAGRKPGEAALKLWMASEFYLHKNTGYSESYVAALEKIVAYYPRPSYWHDLLVTVERKPGYSQKLKLDLFVLKFAVGALQTELEYVGMAETALVQNLPAYAQKVLESGMKARLVTDGAGGRNKRLLAQAIQRAAAETIKPADEADAAAQANGEALARLASVAASYGDYAKAIKLGKAAIAKDALTNLDNVRLHLGAAQILARDSAGGQAAMHLVKAKDGSADIAKYWSLYSRQM